MTIFKRFRDWWNTPLDTPDDADNPEPIEVWQWQINCVGKWGQRQMPQNFGLLIGRRADAEARLKASVMLPNYFFDVIFDATVKIREYSHEGLITYEFTDAEEDIIKQKGAIRCVSKDMKLFREYGEFAPSPHNPFLVAVKDRWCDFDFHPIQPQAQFITGER